MRWAKIGEEYLLYGNVVIIPYSCVSAIFTNKSSFKFVAEGKLWAETGSSCLGVNFILTSVLIPMSSLCLAKMPWYLTNSASISCFSRGFGIDCFHWKFAKNSCRSSSLDVGSSFSSALSLTISS